MSLANKYSCILYLWWGVYLTKLNNATSNHKHSCSLCSNRESGYCGNCILFTKHLGWMMSAQSSHKLSTPSPMCHKPFTRPLCLKFKLEILPTHKTHIWFTTCNTLTIYYDILHIYACNVYTFHFQFRSQSFPVSWLLIFDYRL